MEKITSKQAYEAMILMLYEYYKASGSTDIADILSGGEYIDGEPADIGIWYMWEEALEKIINGHPPKEKRFVN